MGRWESGKVLKCESAIERSSRDSEDPVDDRTHCNADRTDDKLSVGFPTMVIELVAFWARKGTKSRVTDECNPVRSFRN